MKRKDAIKFLNRLRDAFMSDTEALQAVEILLSKAELLEEKESSSVINPEEFPIPPELRDLSEGLALFSDGACRGNPGPGAFGILIQNARGDIILKSSGVEMQTTNNRMELMGIIQGLTEIDGMEVDYHKPLFIYSDSKYAVEGMKSWIKGWKERGWKKSDNKVPENVDLWMRLDELMAKFSSLHFVWVKGHAGHPQNEYCDGLCNQALDDSGI